jgi:hypothetical protein
MTRRLSCCARAPRHRSRSTPFLALTARTPKRRTLSGHSVLRQTGPGQQSTHGPRVAAEAEAAAQGQRALRTSPRARISPRRSARPSEVPRPAAHSGPSRLRQRRQDSGPQRSLSFSQTQQAHRSACSALLERSHVFTSAATGPKRQISGRHRAATMQPNSAAQRMRRGGTGEPAACERRNPRLRT